MTAWYFNLLACFLLFFINVCDAAVQLVVPDVYKLIKVNGEAASNDFFSQNTVVDIKRGENILIVQYSELFENYDDDDHVTIKSASQVIIFTLKETSHQKYIMVTPIIADSLNARKFAQSPTIEIKSLNENSVQQDAIFVLNQSLTEFKAGLAFKKIAEHSSQLAASSENDRQIKKSNDALNKLKFWWRNADKEQQKQFVEFIEQK
ncbi:DUF2057 family protein [Colwellia hornerae]|uniref:DUF2057 domain-containing protein n=1 Tax=Colwellia hornerae TaxID=89402 RepID=A0A5C6QQZ1_9GAMM|nr:DUF2057 family protein [Colwellia hornerae]TWX57675.1 DUF2057 domain-containing protein [Colwellia hornerae]TWX62594.1 DUF2057 domain-containing protein [Colwellia hornerae]TWX71505.1 DUF2057 domain-containing protein [Colwellia hornerae]